MREKIKEFLPIVSIGIMLIFIVFTLSSCIGFVKVLVVAPISSSFRDAAKKTVTGIEMKLEEVNKNGGILGKKIRMVTFDDKGNPDYVSDKLREVLSRNNYIAVVGAPFSRIAIPVSNICEELDIPFITSVATNPEVTKGKEYAFCACFTDEIQGKAVAHFVYEKLRLKKGGVFYDIDDPYSDYLAKSFRDEFEKLGGKIIAFYPHPHEPVTVEYPLQKMLEQGVQFVFNPDLYIDGSEVYKELRKQGFEGPIIFGDGVDAPQLLSRVNKPYNVFYISHYSIDNPKWAEFVNKYKEKYKEEPNIEAYLAYDAMGLLVEAIKKANTFERPAIKDVLKNITYDGITGKIEFKNSNDPVKPVYVYGFYLYGLEKSAPVKVWEYVPNLSR